LGSAHCAHKIGLGFWTNLKVLKFEINVLKLKLKRLKFKKKPSSNPHLKNLEFFLNVKTKIILKKKRCKNNVLEPRLQIMGPPLKH
jgi:hypothetical protein